MNARGGTAWSRAVIDWGARLAAPRAFLVVSAHWETRGVAVSGTASPELIYDFGGFPDDLYRLEYPAPGSPEVAREIVSSLAASGIETRIDETRGLDHGAWSPLLFLRPAADVPVLQLSLDRERSLPQLADVGRALRPLRDAGVLVLGSGNIVHNLRTMDFANHDAPVADWAAGFDSWTRDRLAASDVDALCRPETAPNGRLAHPTREHYAPLVIVAGAARDGASVAFPFEGFEHATISMRCVELG
jgi:4,5-DOPA dioxygenase extradiol